MTQSTIMLDIAIVLFLCIAYLIGKRNGKSSQLPEPKSDLALQLSDRYLDTIDTTLAKILSGRFIAVVLDTIVFPGCVILCGYLTHQKIVEPETFIAVLGGYALLVKETRLKYFERTDRKEEDKIKGDNLDKNISESNKTVS